MPNNKADEWLHVVTLERRVAALERELSDFSYIVSHDLGAPLRHIEGFSELLRRNADTSPEEFTGFIELIRGAAEKCSLMLEELLDYSRVQQAALTIATCDLNHVLEHAQLQLRAAIGESQAEFAAGALGSVQADQTLLTQALLHILDNAIKFQRPGVRPYIAIDVIPDENSWVITVADNGIGVNIAEQERLFRMFYRGHAQVPGHGTGLTIARRILRRHGGDVQFVASIAGACAKITMPRMGMAIDRRAA
jgi:signal transduction histidine kinase